MADIKYQLNEVRVDLRLIREQVPVFTAEVEAIVRRVSLHARQATRSGHSVGQGAGQGGRGRGGGVTGGRRNLF